MKNAALLAAIFLMACDSSTPTDDTDIGTDTDTDTDATAEETCNGLDDDGDGEIDEGFPDTDGDGIADCVDEDCDIDLAAAASTPQTATCTGPEPVAEAWDLVVEWMWESTGADRAYDRVSSAPMIQHLIDTDRDGDVDSGDVPVIFVAAGGNDGPEYARGFLLAGDDGRPLSSVGSVHGYGHVGFADVNGDDKLDIISRARVQNLFAYDARGDQLWRAAAKGSELATVEIVDLDGSGDLVQLAGTHLGSVEDGKVVAELPFVSVDCLQTQLTADLDLDGVEELITGRSVLSADGSSRWAATLTGRCEDGWHAVPVQADDDPEAEVAFVGEGQLKVYEHDGTPKFAAVVGDTDPGPPCLADFDGDGEIEIALPSWRTFAVRELDGTGGWTLTGTATARWASCAAFDFDADGASEIVSFDSGAVVIRSGRDGAILARWETEVPQYGFGHPVIADVDQDGAAEIIVPRGESGIAVLGHDGAGWPAAPTVWTSFNYVPAARSADGRTPAGPVDWWNEDGRIRAQRTEEPRADLTVAITDSCVAGCEPGSVVELAVQVSNVGWRGAPAGTPVAIYSLEGSERTLLTTFTIDEPIPAGRSVGSLAVSLTRDQIGADGVVARVGDDGDEPGLVDDCDASNDEATWVDPCG